MINVGVIPKEDILKLSNQPNLIQIYSVVQGLEKEAFTINYENENKYTLTYISNRKNLVGYFIETGLKEKDKYKKVLGFCQLLSDEFNDIDQIVVFNNYQKLIRTAYEKDGFFTASDLEYTSMVNKDVSIKSRKGLIVLPFIRKPELYNSIFKGKTHEDDSQENKIYLMFNPDTNKIKIGISKNPIYRERTLQSKEPNIVVICSWIAPKTVEKELHFKYANKRVRGEWFNLNPRDLKEINSLMKTYKKIKFISSPTSPTSPTE